MGYVIYSTWERKAFEHFEDAVAYARSFAEAKAQELASANAKEGGGTEIEVSLEQKDIYADSNGLSNDIYIETRIEAVATEKSDWI
ncbi:hypothetical protein [Cloacibacillus porcorum]|uniref:hypothetical protein n=1 Tax=Cloacibacillus porcorum TaxID=1197717 RepID=UPI003CFFA7F0